MKTYTTIIVEDRKDNAIFLQKALEKNCPFVQVLGTCANVTKAKEEIQKLRPDFIFLDVELGANTGFDLLQDLGFMDFKVVFVTEFKQYMLDALHASATDFLHKPYTEKQLVEAVERVTKALQKSSLDLVSEQMQKLLNYIESPIIIKSVLRLPDKYGIHPIRLQDIVYCEAKGNRTVFYSVSEEPRTVSKSLGDFEELLAPYNLVRVQQSYIIHLSHISIYKKKGGDIIMKGYPNLEIGIARDKKEWFDDLYQNFTIGLS